jgi:hypothetical protein
MSPAMRSCPAANIYLRLAKHFDNAAETYRQVRLFGPANDAEARRGVCAWIAETDKRVA